MSLIRYSKGDNRQVLITISAIILVLVSGLVNTAKAERLKDLVSISGIRTNQLVGYGLVVGLDGTGDQTNQTVFTVQSLRSMLRRYGITLPKNANPRLDNVAAVSIHAVLPPFAKIGQNIDITVSSLGNADSLRGGSLLLAPLKGIDGQTYAMAQGNLVVGGFGAKGNDGSRVVVNVPSAGRIPNGATVEKLVPNTFSSNDKITLNLHAADFTTVNRITVAINRMIGPGTAHSVDAVSIDVNAPKDSSQRVAFISFLEGISVDPADPPARIIVNARTGTIVIGQHVRVLPFAVTHGSLTVSITESQNVSQPAAFARRGRTVVTGESDINIDQKKSHMYLFETGVTLRELVRAVNEVGAAPGDLMAILEALKQSGALRAELIVI
ncbi:MAG TPA: flagellar basal body P-ring protein FlgI [Gammaproteobacteria bacterium]|nr:flagellar basal body P-ring protein FlgI [Gammaproteobacteria bacterium]